MSPDLTPDVDEAIVVVRRTLDRDDHPDDLGDLLIALLGWDLAVQSLATVDHPRAGVVLLSSISWLLV